jgi:hypothetical protein
MTQPTKTLTTHEENKRPKRCPMLANLCTPRARASASDDVAGLDAGGPESGVGAGFCGFGGVDG